jgi:hypothetical protein
MRSKQPGDKVTLTYQPASGASQTVQVTLGQMTSPRRPLRTPVAEESGCHLYVILDVSVGQVELCRDAERGERRWSANRCIG